jgi:RNA polymerase sigma factor (sigma-70 family)
MSGAANILQHIRSVLEAPADGGRDDAQLLDAFTGRRDQTAFATLVRRHGRLVFGVCRRVLGNAHEAEDAFQATFLVLARRAGVIRKRSSLSSWLHGVAYRLAMKIRSRAARQREREARAAAVAQPAEARDDLSWNEVRAVLDEELNRLPERLRAPLILCYLTGKTQDEAAQHLHWSLGTFRRRLERGRTLLRDRLTRRGLALSAALSALLAQDALAALPVPLLASTVAESVAFALAQGKSTSPSAILAEELMKVMSISRLKLVASVLLAIALLAVGTGVALHQTLASDQKPVLAVVNVDDQPPADPPMPRRLLAVCPSGYFFANPVHYGGTADRGLSRVVRQLGQLLGVPDDQSALLSDRAPVPFAPSKENIESTVDLYLDTDWEQHRLVLFFAGHAVELGDKAYLVPVEGELDKASTLIPLDWLYDRLAKCKAREKLLILDVCRFNPQRGVERGRLDKMGDVLDKMLREPPKGVEVLTACTAGQFSYEGDDEGGSLFLNQVSKLREGDGLKDVNDAADKPLPVPALTQQLAKATQTAAQQIFRRDQTVRLAGTEANPGLAFDPKQRKPFRPAIVPARHEGAASRGDVLRVLKLAEGIPPLLPSQRDRRLNFDVLPSFPREVVKLYQDDDKESALRLLINNAAKLLVKHAEAFPDTFPALPANPQQRAQFFQQITQRQMMLALVYNDLDSKYEELKLVADEAKKEPPQWQASYTYVQAMLLYRMAQFYEYNAMLGQMRKEMLPAFDPKVHRGYRLVPKPAVGDRDAQKLAEMAKKLLKQLADDHKDTPWELIAKRELLTNLGLEWQPY